MDGIIQHKGISESSQWQQMPFAQQMANVGSEVFRAGKWKVKGKEDRAQLASDRALELLDFTISAAQQSNRNLRELVRLREVLCDYFYGENMFGSTPESLNKYFNPFSFKASQQRNGMIQIESGLGGNNEKLLADNDQGNR